jgi:metal-sulfur cluster biosynthetic enzyme
MNSDWNAKTFTTGSSPSVSQNESGTSEDHVREALRKVLDPEVGINVLDLGLVYGIAVEQHVAQITMTMTTPACPLGGQIKRGVNAEILRYCPQVERVEIQFVWDPPWGPERMSARARELLGWSK